MDPSLHRPWAVAFDDLLREGDHQHLPLDRLKAFCQKEHLPQKAIETVQRILQDKQEKAMWDRITRECAIEAARACADMLHTAAALAPSPPMTPTPGATGVNLVFNPSFEQDDGTGHPEGWYVEWRDLKDRAGQAAWYAAKTHWENHVRTGVRSANLRWCPPAGIEWRPTWRHAIRVSPGETYQAWAQVDLRGRGESSVGLVFFDASYEPIDPPASSAAQPGTHWQKVGVSAQAPAKACWLKVVLRCQAADGAIWFDDIELLRR